MNNSVVLFGLTEGTLRFSLFAGIFMLMAVLETWLPRRKRRHDRLKRWPANFGLLISAFLSVSVVTFLVPVTALLTAFYAEANGWGLFHALDWPIWLEALIAFLILDWVIWAQHLVTHKVPILWRVHRVHHTDEDLDASSAVRFHPVEIILSIFVKSAAVLLLGSPAWLVVVFEAVVNGSALFNHANLKLPLWLDRVLRYVLVTPDMHRVHHSVINRETDSNYGFALSIWDRIFRTYTPEPEGGHEGMVLGLSEWQDDAPTRFGWLAALPFKTPPKSTDQ